MSKLTVQFFASLREQLGAERLELDWPEPKAATELVKAIEAQLGEDAAQILDGPEILIAVNQTMVDRDHQIQPSDEVAFFPPVTGG